jgi:hypothetical protein
VKASILTYTGKLFDLLDPDPERIDLRDIAHALARIGRFTGHGDEIFTDAQHSVITCDLAPEHLRRWALLHDAEEAYVGDVSSPMKHAMREISGPCGYYASPYDYIVGRIRAAVSVRFGVPIEDIKQYDDEAATIEVAINGPHSSAEHTWPTPPRACASAASVWPVALAEFMFLSRCKQLGIS